MHSLKVGDPMPRAIGRSHGSDTNSKVNEVNIADSESTRLNPSKQVNFVDYLFPHGF